MGRTDFDALKKRKNLNFGAVGWKPAEGKNPIRILPPSSEYVPDKHGGGDRALDRVATPFRSHFLRLEGRDLAVFRCLRDLDGQRCPACTFYWGHKDDSDKGVAKIAARYNNSLRFLMNVLDPKDLDKGVQSFECGVQIRDGVLEYAADEDYGDVLDVEEGRTFFIQKGKHPRTGRTQYKVKVDLETSSVIDDLPDGWVGGLDNLEAAMPEVRDADSIQKLVDEARVQVGLEPINGGAVPARTRKPDPEPEPDDEPEDEDAEEVNEVKAADPPPAEEVEDEPAEDSGGGDDVDDLMDELFGE